MQALYIPHLLKAPDRTQRFYLDEFIGALDTLTPLRGKIRIRHGGTFLEVAVQAETIVTLTCDRCLQHYNHRLLLDTSELIWLNDNANSPQSHPQEREIAWEDLSEILAFDGYFELDTWLYEQLSLALPVQQFCGKNCQQPLKSVDTATNPPTDSRWRALAALKNQLSEPLN